MLARSNSNYNMVTHSKHEDNSKRKESHVHLVRFPVFDTYLKSVTSSFNCRDSTSGWTFPIPRSYQGTILPEGGTRDSLKLYVSHEMDRKGTNKMCIPVSASWCGCRACWITRGVLGCRYHVVWLYLYICLHLRSKSMKSVGSSTTIVNRPQDPPLIPSSTREA
jgi:hypothetical protein